MSGLALFATFAGLAAAGDALSKRTRVGKALTAPVATMLVGALCVNLGLAAVDLAEIKRAQSVLVTVATPLLLLGTNLRSIVKGAGPLLPGFALASFGTLLGAFLGLALIGDRLAAALGGAGDAAGLAAGLAAKNIGGGFNFVAVSESAGVSAGAVALALAADNIAALVFFPLNSWLAGPGPAEGGSGDDGGASGGASSASSKGEAGGAASGAEGAFEAQGLTLSLALALGIVAAVQAFGAGGNTIAVASALTIALASAAPKVFEPLREPGYALARVFLSLFFASAGLAGGKVLALDASALLPVAALLAIIYATHLAAVALARRAFGMTPLEAAIVSNAAVGGPATAAALAQAKGAKDPTPAVLLGNLGNAAATFAALAALPLLRACL